MFQISIAQSNVLYPVAQHNTHQAKRSLKRQRQTDRNRLLAKPGRERGRNFLSRGTPDADCFTSAPPSRQPHLDQGRVGDVAPIGGDLDVFPKQHRKSERNGARPFSGPNGPRKRGASPIFLTDRGVSPFPQDFEIHTEWSAQQHHQKDCSTHCRPSFRNCRACHGKRRDVDPSHREAVNWLADAKARCR